MNEYRSNWYPNVMLRESTNAKAPKSVRIAA